MHLRPACRPRRLATVVLAGVLSLVAADAGATTLAIVADRDNTIYSPLETDEPGSWLSNGAGSGVFTGVNGEGRRMRGLLHFDVAGVLPAGAQLESVRLDLQLNMTRSGEVDVGLHRVLAAWGEGTSDASRGEGQGAPASAGDATWIHTSYPGSLWTSPGGDFVTEASAITGVSDTGSYAWSGPGLLDDVLLFLANPALNHGWLLEGGIERDGKRFASRHHAVTEWRPTLHVEYSEVPEPSSACLLGLGLALLSRRRRAAPAR